LIVASLLAHGYHWLSWFHLMWAKQRTTCKTQDSMYTWFWLTLNVDTCKSRWHMCSCSWCQTFRDAVVRWSTRTYSGTYSL
jgi:hypothetical protein